VEILTTALVPAGRQSSVLPGKQKRVDKFGKASKTCSEEDLDALPLGRNTNDQQRACCELVLVACEY
jgi:hypothetical protein